MDSLPQPEVVSCFFAAELQPAFPAMHLRWNTGVMGLAERTWFFPQKVTLTGSAPERFGVTLQRHDADAYVLKVLWNHMFFSWQNLTRVQILASSLTPILRALGTDLWYLLNQPIDQSEWSQPCKVAA